MGEGVHLKTDEIQQEHKMPLLSGLLYNSASDVNSADHKSIHT